MVRKIACGPSKLALGGPTGHADFEAAVILLQVPLAEKKRSGPSKIVRALKNMTLRAK